MKKKISSLFVTVRTYSLILGLSLMALVAQAQPRFFITQNGASVSSSYSFGMFEVGANSGNITFKIDNNGNTDLNLSNFQIIGSHSTMFSSVSWASPVLSANSSTTFGLKFSPTSPGAKNALVEMIYSQANSPIPLSFIDKTTANGLGGGARNICVEGSKMYVATNGGLSISTDGGNTFVNKTTANGLGSNIVYSVAVVGSTVYVATSFGLSISTDDGNTFVNKTTANGLAGNFVFDVKAVGSKVYVATDREFCVSTDGGNTFVLKTAANGLPALLSINKVFVDGNNVYVSHPGGGLSISTDGGNTFVNRTTANGLGSNNVGRIYAIGTTVYVATNGGGLSISTDGGNTFVNRTTANGLGTNWLEDVYTEGSTIYVASSLGLSMSTDGGNTFISSTPFNGLLSTYLNNIGRAGNMYYASSSSGFHIFQNFVKRSIYLTGLATASQPFMTVKQNVTVIPNNTGIHNFGNVNVGTNNELTFTIENSSLADLNLGNLQINGSDASMFSTVAWANNSVSAGNNTNFKVKFTPNSAGLKTAFVTIGSNMNFNPLPTGFTNKPLSVFTETVYAKGQNVYVGSVPGAGGLHISNNGGNTFVHRTTSHGLGSNAVYTVQEHNNKIYVATSNGLSISTDGGATFTNRTTANGLGTNVVYDLFVTDSKIYAATSGGLSTSIDGGNTFTNRLNVDGFGTNDIRDVHVDGNNVYVSYLNGTNNGVVRSTDGGNTFWNLTVRSAGVAASLAIYDVYAKGEIVCIASNTEIQISIDGGNSISHYATTANGLGSNTVLGVFIHQNAIYAATQNGLSISTDGGKTFSNYTTANGLPDNGITSIYIDPLTNVLYAGTSNGSVAISKLSTTPYNFTVTGNGVANGLQINSVSPARNALNVANNATIQANFNVNINPATLNHTNARVYGSQTGFYTAGTWAGGGTNTISFSPTYSFKNGETVTVSFTTALRGTNNEFFTATQQYQFTVRTNATPGVFVKSQSVTTPDSPQTVWSADIDKDGDIDVVSANWTANNISVLKNNGNGVLSSKTDYIGNTQAIFSHITDVDNDGDMDIIASYSGGFSISVFKNNGDGTFANKVNYNTGMGAVSIYSADLDGDGDMDLAVACSNLSVNNLSIFRNNGNGTFANKVDYSVGGSNGAFSVFGADIENDGDIDLAVVNRGGNYVSVFKNNGNGTFAPRTQYTTNSMPSGVYFNDFDADGDADMAVCNYGSSTLSIFTNQGNGTFNPKADYTIGTGVWSVYGLDADGDGDIDLVGSNVDRSVVSILKNNGNATFGTSTSFPSETYTIYTSPFDSDGDGDMDLAAANFVAKTVTIFKNILPITVKQNTDFISASTGTYNFGSVSTGSNTTRTFTINNPDPNFVPNINSINISGTNANVFTTSNLSNLSIAANGSVTFDLTFYTVLGGNYSAFITINNTGYPSQYTFAVFATALSLQPDLIVKNNNNPISNGSGIIDLGSKPVNQAITRTIQLENVGQPLSISGVSIQGSAAGAFSTVFTSATFLTSLGKSAFDLVFTTSLGGNYEAFISVFSNDPLKNPYTFRVRAEAVEPVSVVALEGGIAFVTTWVGNGTWGNVNGIGQAVRLNQPNGGVFDELGNFYFCDYGNHQIKKLNVATRQVSLVAGSTSGFAEGIGSAARFSFPTYIAYDGAGNLYVADQANHRIRKIVIATQTVSTLTGTGGAGGVNGNLAVATFDNPYGIVADGNKALYVSERLGHRIRKIDLINGTVSTVAGSGSMGSMNGIGVLASFNKPLGLSLDRLRNRLYVADYSNHLIRQIELTNGSVSTLAGIAGLTGTTDGIGTTAKFMSPSYIGFNGLNTLWVADHFNHRIRTINLNNQNVSTLTGSISGWADGKGTQAKFNQPHSFGISSDQQLYVTDVNTNSIRQVSRLLDFGTVTQNIPSSVLTYSVQAQNITNPVFISASAGIQISLDGTTFTSSLSLNPVAKNVPFTTVFARVNAGIVGKYNGQINHSSVGASFSEKMFITALVEPSMPKIAVQQGLSPILQNGTTNWQKVVANTTKTQTLQIQNVGTEALQIHNLRIQGSGAGAFSTVFNSVPFVSIGNSVAFDLVFQTALGGNHQAFISVFSNDPNKNPYIFTVFATATVPALQVSNPNFVTVAHQTGEYFFGNNAAGVPMNRNFTLRNTGNDILHIQGLSIQGANAGAFSTVFSSANFLSAGSQVSVNFQFQTAALGFQTAFVSVFTNDPYKNPYTFVLTGNSFLNQPPTITPVSPISTFEDAGVRFITLTGISAGESFQTASLSFTNFNTALLSNITVSYVPNSSFATVQYNTLANASGTGNLQITVSDGFVTTSTFITISVGAVNDPPTFDLPVTVIRIPPAAGKQHFLNFATAITDGDPEFNQTVHFELVADDPTLFSEKPHINTQGRLMFNPTKSATGFTSVTVYARDEGQTAQPHSNTAMKKFVIIISDRNLVYWDNNKNNAYDLGEQPAPRQLVTINDNGKITYTLSDQEGYYTHFSSAGTYFASVRPAEPFISVFPNQYTATLPKAEWLMNKDFGLQNTGFRNLVVSSWDSWWNPARPGFNTYYYIDYTNRGTNTENGTVEFEVDPRLTFVTSRIPVVQNGNKFQFNYADLKPYQWRWAGFEFKVPADMPLGTKLHSNGKIESLANDIQPHNNFYANQRIVRGSYDPNDKHVNPEGNISPEFVANGEYLEYRVRFQNTGTDTAFHIRVEDQLDTDLDWSTMEMGVASHNFYLEIDQNGKAVWNFPNILLPDDKTDNLGSNGFFTYRIKTKKGLALGTQIKSKAYIYFDFNAPIITNEPITTVNQDLAAPVVSSLQIPMNTPRIAANEPLYVQFSENVKRVAGKKIHIKENGVIVQTFDMNDPEIVITGNLLYIKHLDFNTSKFITVEIEAGALTDIKGNPFGGLLDWKMATPLPNQRPNFVKGGNISVLKNSGNYSQTWASQISMGEYDQNQTLTFEVQNSNAGLFGTQPQLNASGVLTFVPKTDQIGSAEIKVKLKDDGGTANGGVDTSVEHIFFISVTEPVVVNPPNPNTGTSSNNTTNTGNTTSTGSGNTNSGTNFTSSSGNNFTSTTNSGTGTNPATPAVVALNAPQGSVTSKKATTVLLVWSDPNTDETGYEIWRTEGDQVFQKIGQVGADEVRFEDTNLIPNTLYRYQIQAIRKTDSKRSEIFETRTLPQNPLVQGVRVCEGSMGSMKAMGAPHEGVYVWYENNAVLLESANQVLGVQNMTSKRQFSVSVKANGQESERVAVQNEVLPVPVAQILEGQVVRLCSEESQLSALKQTGAYIWEKDGFVVGKEQKLKVKESGVYTLKVSNGLCESQEAKITVDLVVLPKAELSASAPALCGTGAETHLAVPLAEGASYEWTLNGQPFAKGSNQIKTGQVGVYQVRSSLKGCVQVSKTLEIIREEPKNASIQQNYACEGTKSVLSAPVYAGYSYRWYKHENGKSVLLANTPSFETTENDLHIYLEMKSLACQANASAFVKRAKVSPELTVLENACEKKMVKVLGNLQGGVLQIRKDNVLVKEIAVGTEAKEVSLEDGVYQFVYNHSQAACQQTAFVKEVKVSSCIISSKEDEALARASSVYPNPTKDRLQVRIQDVFRGKVSLTLYTLQGKELQQVRETKMGETFDYQVDMSGLAQGVYLLEIRTEQGVAHKRIVKE